MILSIKELKEKILDLINKNQGMTQQELNKILLDSESFQDYTNIQVVCMTLSQEQKLRLIPTNKSFCIKKLNVLTQ